MKHLLLLDHQLVHRHCNYYYPRIAIILQLFAYMVSGLSPAYIPLILDTRSMSMKDRIAVIHWGSPPAVEDFTYSIEYPRPRRWIQAISRRLFGRSYYNRHSLDSQLDKTAVMNNIIYTSMDASTDPTAQRFVKQKYDSIISTNGKTVNQSPPYHQPPQQPRSGWMPYEFPNPQVEPDQCGLSKLVHNNDNNTDYSINTDLQLAHSSRLLLCDPDALLDSTYIQRIADALQNFTFYYGSKSRRPSEEETLMRQMLSTPTTPELQTLQGHLLSSDHPAIQQSQSILVPSSMYLLQSSIQTQVSLHWLPPVEIGIAMTRKIDIASILRSSGYYSFEDAEGMINDAAQIFASVLLDQWWKESKIYENQTHIEEEEEEEVTSGVLIFLSLQDRVCFISASQDISDILPWWRLDHVVAHMKTNLQTGEFGQALLNAIAGISHMLDAGPPSVQEKVHDFVSRFGFVLSFALFTFLFAIFGEFRDRQRKLYRADIKSRLTLAEKLEAKKLQQEYKTSSCPICLDSFEIIESEDGLKRVDSFGIPIVGNDGLPLKLLRCGHIMDTTCWLNWVKSGHGASLKCPVCREDLGGASHRKSASTSLVLQEAEGLTANSRHSRTYGSLSRNT